MNFKAIMTFGIKDLCNKRSQKRYFTLLDISQQKCRQDLKEERLTERISEFQDMKFLSHYKLLRYFLVGPFYVGSVSILDPTI